MLYTFKIAASQLLAQPISSQKLIVHSTSDSDRSTITIAGGWASDPILLTGQYEAQSALSFNTLSSISLNGAESGTISIYTQGTAASGRIIFSGQPQTGDSLTIGVSNGYTVTYNWIGDGTGDPLLFVDALHNVLIGATAAESAINLRKAMRNGDVAINDHTGKGTVYSSLLSAHPNLLVTDISGIILTISDTLACNRHNPWTMAQSGTAALSVSAPINGLNGTLIASFAPGDDLCKITNITLDDEYLVLNKMPAKATFISDWINVGGGPCSVYLADGGSLYGLSCDYQVSVDGVNPLPWQSLGTQNGERSQFPINEQSVEYIRLKLTSANTSSVAVSAKLSK